MVDVAGLRPVGLGADVGQVPQIGSKRPRAVTKPEEQPRPDVEHEVRVWVLKQAVSSPVGGGLADVLGAVFFLPQQPRASRQEGLKGTPLRTMHDRIEAR